VNKILSFGKHVDYSTNVIMTQLGVDLDDIRGLTQSQRLDFAIWITPSVTHWFDYFKESVDQLVIVMMILHATRAEVSA
jgi:protoheme ferro-lyase